MPWWGWLLVAVVTLVALYYFVILGLVVKVFKRVDRGVGRSPLVDQKFRDRNRKSPFRDDPFFDFDGD